MVVAFTLAGWLKSMTKKSVLRAVMIRSCTALVVVGLCATAVPLVGAQPALAALAQGEAAPDFTLQGALGGKPLTFSLKDALKKGPVVLYFFPAAFTKGCTLEAHAFAEATEDFAKQGATVVGVTAGNVDRVAEFSKEECRSKFAVLADPGAKVAGLYKSLSSQGTFLHSDRSSYVITPDDKIVLSYTSQDPETHVSKTLDAVTAWHASAQ
ncbi:peroxiredoxin [Acetobacter senegalensis]|nr:peroxiredoxin [Acetobacter senegalensis]